jgi:hypothetical protein
MSGGSFDYAYGHVAQFADELENKLDTAGVEGFDPWNSPEVVARLRRLVIDARRVSALMKEAEWLYSGDTGEDTFSKRVAKLDEESASEAVATWESGHRAGREKAPTYAENQQLRDRIAEVEEWADALAGATGNRFGANVGEHTDTNNPWQNALDVLTAREEPKP